ncbi:MAG: hypothetical protein HN348_34545, partial [Proteobacteria bacterium]|nr:hypothetical protein [Pseudomonadota bacterium]
QSFDSTWSDNDGDGMFDSHTSIGHLDIYLSRLTGKAAKIQTYLDRVHDYKTNGPLLEPSMFIFIDDDWQDPYFGAINSTWGLESVYSTFVRMEDVWSTKGYRYLDFMGTEGAEYVYQWIHASPTELYFIEDGDWYETVTLNEIVQNGAVGSFFNLFNCSAARFTETNLASTYLHRPYGLATVGSTKAGGIFNPYPLHAKLVAGGNWGKGFVKWYEEEGRYDDSWFLGMGIQGDPTLVLSEDTRRSMQDATPMPKLSQAQSDALMHSLLDGPGDRGGSFDEYQDAHPQFTD